SALRGRGIAEAWCFLNKFRNGFGGPSARRVARDIGAGFYRRIEVALRTSQRPIAASPADAVRNGLLGFCGSSRHVSALWCKRHSQACCPCPHLVRRSNRAPIWGGQAPP